jgi:hypothetical protein
MAIRSIRALPFFLAAMALLAGRPMLAEIVSTALLVFPAQTEMIEYDNLYALRRLPNYAALRQRFSGKALEEVKAALRVVDIEESQVHEIVMGSTEKAFYGLVAGSFSGAAAMKVARQKGIWPHVADGEKIFCTKGGACFVFLEDSLAAFGSLDELKIILETRLGASARLSPNQTLLLLMSKTDSHAPERGVVLGGQVSGFLTDSLENPGQWDMGLSRITANISAIGYSVNIDGEAHVGATVECKSPTAAALVAQMLGALGSVQSVASRTGSTALEMPFQNLRATAAGNEVDLKMDAPVPN